VQQVPSTIGFIAGLTKKGVDNEITFVGSRAELISNWGEPNLTDYGKNYGQGLNCAYNYLGESGSLYFMRAMPDDATYSNLRIDCNLAPTDGSASIAITYVASVNTKAEIETNLAVDGTTNPIAMLYPVGRGDYYNGLGVRFTEYSNPLISGVYVLDIYEKQSDGDDVIIESFEVSFNPQDVDTAGDSLYIVDVLDNYSNVLRADMTLASGAYTSGYDLVGRVYDKEIGAVSVTLIGTPVITDNKQDFSDWENATETGNSTYMVIAKDGRGATIYGWCGAAGGSDDDTINVFQSRDLTGAIQGWLGETTTFDVSETITYEIRKTNASVASAFTSSEPAPLKKGSDGALLDASGDLVTSEAENLLEQAYDGTIDDRILDTEEMYFTMVFDCGYPSDVKTKISTLVQTRRDCVAILDNGDNASVNDALDTRNNTHTFNNYFCALYESYTKISDSFTGTDQWVSPVFHMSTILPRNDRVAELWYAPAGFNRAAIDTIKEARYNPRLGQRDQMYLKQLNPIVKFNQGYVMWGQLTTQAKASALQDLNIVRLVLYCKKAIEGYCRFFIFEQNDSITWSRVSGDITEFLDEVSKKRGLDSFSVSVGATEYEKKRKTFHVDIELQPTRTVEKIELNFYIK